MKGETIPTLFIRGQVPIGYIHGSGPGDALIYAGLFDRRSHPCQFKKSATPWFATNSG